MLQKEGKLNIKPTHGKKEQDEDQEPYIALIYGFSYRIDVDIPLTSQRVFCFCHQCPHIEGKNSKNTKINSTTRNKVSHEKVHLSSFFVCFYCSASTIAHFNTFVKS
tara:strand:- start:148 stop:468 length:321 start_codon:yes stop_codon:yes gene_type:complete